MRRAVGCLYFTVLVFALSAEADWLEEETGLVCTTFPASRYSVVDEQIVPEEGLFSYHPPGSRALEPSVLHTSVLGRGEVLKVGVTLNQRLSELSVRIVNDENVTVCRSSGFHLGSEASTEVWYCLVGVPTHVEGGVYRIVAEGHAGQRAFLYIGNTMVAETEFASEQIVLDKELTELRKKPDPRKTEQARQLWDVLIRFDPEAHYHTGEFAHPLALGRQSAGFGDIRTYLYYDGEQSRSIHNGLDLAAPSGTPVHAAAAGRVVFVRERIVTGKTVCLEHLPGVYSLYYHLSTVAVSEEQIVEQGHEIGKVGSSGLATGAHLHWEIRVSGVAVDPLPFTTEKVIDTRLVSGIMDGESDTDLEGR